ncbi:MAG: CaiB/BaiF CoA transferase family protein [Hyphomicrobiaceae bacterium]
MPGPLDGLLVLDFSTLLPGPMATLMLAEAGAEVLKIERPGMGDEMRTYHPRWGADSVNFALLNRGKKSIALDLKDAADRARLAPLVAKADIIVEQFRPGVMDRLGLGYETVSAVNPGIIYCSITGYGQTGPKRDAAGHDVNYMGDAGLLALSLGSAEQPVLPPALIADIAGGTYPAMLNILLALRERDRTGKGARLDIAMAEGVLPFTYWALGEGERTGAWPGNATGLVTGGSPRYQLYACADGRFVAAGPIEQKFWLAFTAAIGLDAALVDDGRDPAATKAGCAAIIRARPSDHWRPILAEADCCCTIVATLEEALADPHFKARGQFDARVANAEGSTQTAVPMPIARQFRPTADKAVRAPLLGEHNGELPT